MQHKEDRKLAKRYAARAAFGYFGSKQRLAKTILGHLPPHHCWVELFGGALAVTMAKPPAMIEVVNDLDEHVVNTFRQIRDHGSQLIELVELTPYARSELVASREIVAGDSDLERARKFLVHAMMSVNGVMAGKRGGFSISDTYSRGGREARVNRWSNYPKRLLAVMDRLKSVRIENKDGIELLREFSNKPATLVYIDPPYLADRGAGYKIEAPDEAFHKKLLQQALVCDCMVVMSGYMSPTYSRLLEDHGGWRRFELDSATQNTNGDRFGRDEILWMNNPAEQAWAHNRVPVDLTEKETRDGRVNPPREPTKGDSGPPESAD